MSGSSGMLGWTVRTRGCPKMAIGKFWSVTLVLIDPAGHPLCLTNMS
jgi:hypothetical protein